MTPPTAGELPSLPATARRALDLPALGFGGGSGFGTRGESAARELLGYAYDAGFRYFDTAPFYGHGLSEHRLGAALRARPRADFILSTKVGRRLRPNCSAVPQADRLPFDVFYDYTYDGVMRSFEDSLQRLGLCRIDIAYIHDVNPRWQGADYERRFAEAMDGAYPALARLRDEGLVRAIGVGVKDPDVCLRFARAGEFDCFMLAGAYTLLEHHADDEFLPYCHARGIAVVLASPFNSGILATGAVPGASYFYAPANDDVAARTRRLDTVCRRHRVPLGAAALQFVLAHPAIECAMSSYATTAEVDTNQAWVRYDIPAALWDDLKAEGLIPRTAPVPGGAVTAAAS